MAKGRPYAAFDIDGTVLRWQLYHALNDELVKCGLIDKRAFDAVRKARMSWKKRTDDQAFVEYEKEMIRVFNDHLPTLLFSDVEAATKHVIETYKDQVYTYTRDLIRELQSKNYLLFAVSGSPDFIVKPLAKYYGFDDSVATSYEINNGTFTGKHELSIGRKPALLTELVTKHGAQQAYSIAVGDSFGDHEMLAIVDRAIAFNPDKNLFQKAKDQGWEIIVERKNTTYQLKECHGSYILV